MNYFAYAPDNNYTNTIINELLAANNLQGKVATRAFESHEELNHYINVKNIVPLIRDKFENTTMIETVMCKDFKKFFPNKTCDIHLKENLSHTIEKVYGLTDVDFDDFADNPEKYNEDILFAINFHTRENFNISEQNNITYEFIYNTTILDDTIRKFPDDLSLEFGNIMTLPFWTGYTFTLQKQLDQITVKKLTDLDYEVNYGRLDQLEMMPLTLGIFFEMTSMMALAILLIFVVMLGSQNRGKNHIILRRLGVKEWEFWFCNTLFVFVPTLIITLIIGTIWHFAGNPIFM